MPFLKSVVANTWLEAFLIMSMTLSRLSSPVIIPLDPMHPKRRKQCISNYSYSRSYSTVTTEGKRLGSKIINKMHDSSKDYYLYICFSRSQKWFYLILNNNVKLYEWQKQWLAGFFNLPPRCDSDLVLEII